MATKKGNIFTCKSCGEKKKISEFYKSKSEKHSVFGEICPYCKSCLQKSITDKGVVDINRFKYVLKEHLDKPFCEELFNKVITKNTVNHLGKYIQSLNFKKIDGVDNLTWKHTDLLNCDKKEEIKNENVDFKFEETKNSTEEKFTVTKKMVLFWGKSYSEEEYQFLEETYREWKDRNNCETLAQEKTYKYIAIQELEIRRGQENGLEVDKMYKLQETYRKLINDAGITPKEAKSVTDEEVGCLGVWIRDIERYRPAEYFEDKKKYFDYDSLKEYCERFIFRPMKNLLLGSKEFDKEFNVEGQNDESDE